jgi:threonyl-tRNA synthetase
MYLQNARIVYQTFVQVATIQLDFQLPGRFNCEFIDEDGAKKTPVMIHAAIFGSVERMTGILLEHYAGALPLWLAPIQALILPIADRHLEYAQKIRDEIGAAGIRVEIDSRSETIGKKIRESEMQKIPFMLIVGDKEIEANKVAARRYGEGDKGQMDLEAVIGSIKSFEK